MSLTSVVVVKRNVDVKVRAVKVSAIGKKLCVDKSAGIKINRYRTDFVKANFE